eukprot:TRINITY_DN330_c0_g1_i7.p1 TRINITY_DN330_c0_g1~~TRINITY_DN330_c0_g1_i7.p1  ORF type:complete len:159 (-),score=36.18 TRINITY_DN330_c0_g1_i7:520-996(-)
MILEDSQIAEVVCQIWIDKPSESTSYCRAVFAALNEHLAILNRPLIITKDTAHFSTSYPKLLNAWKNIQKTQKKRTHEPAKARVITLVSSRAIWQVFNPYDAEELRDMVIFDGLTTLGKRPADLRRLQTKDVLIKEGEFVVAPFGSIFLRQVETGTWL